MENWYINMDAVREQNKLNAFKHFVGAIKKQNPDTVEVDGNIYSYRTKRGLLKRYIHFPTFKEFVNSEYYNNRMEKVNGFIFVEIKQRTSKNCI